MAYPYVYITCPQCNRERGYNVEQHPDPATPPPCTFDTCRPPTPCTLSGFRFRNAQVGASEASAVAIHPQTGEVVYCFQSPSDPLPEKYAREGFEKQQFHSLASLRQFCRERGQVNDVLEYDSSYEGFSEEMARARESRDRQQLESYRRERHLAERAERDANRNHSSNTGRRR